MPGYDGESARTQKREIEITGPMKVHLSENSFMGLVVICTEVSRKSPVTPIIGGFHHIPSHTEI
jgi:hypothetical protein